MNIINLSQKNSILSHFLAELRDKDIQKDSLRFRRNLERVAEICAYEISKTLEYKSRNVITQLGQLKIPVLKEEIVLATILRAGIPFHYGFLNYFDSSHSAFISAYRKTNKDGSFVVKVEYVASPDLNNKVLILCDPMLATGQSIVLSYNALLKFGKPSKLHIACVIASDTGIEYVKSHIPDAWLWTGAIDHELNSKFYIIPGLGDAGDLALGEKI